MATYAKDIEYTLTLSDLARHEPSISHLEAATEHIHLLENRSDLQNLFQGLGRFFEARTDYNTAGVYYGRCRDELEKCPDAAMDFATSLNNLAGLYNSMGRYEEALPRYERAVAIAEQALGYNHPNTVTFRENYARLRGVEPHPPAPSPSEGEGEEVGGG